MHFLRGIKVLLHTQSTKKPVENLKVIKTKKNPSSSYDPVKS